MSDWFKKLFIDEAKTAISRFKYIAEKNAAKTTTITLYADKWVEDDTKYSQVVSVTGATANSKVDPQPTPEQLLALISAGISLTIGNDSGVVTVYAVGAKPDIDYALQVLITEVHPA